MTTREILAREREQKADKREQRRRRREEKRAAAVASAKTATFRRRVLRLPDVEVMTGLKHSAIYEGVGDGTFPAPIPLGARAVGWIEDEIETWLDQRIAEREARRAV
jgi:prophage regulatory protein